MDETEKALQREAVAIVKQYGFFLPASVKVFLHRLSVFLNWPELAEQLKGK